MKIDADSITKTVVATAKKVVALAQNVGADLSEVASNAVSSATKNRLKLPVIPKPSGGSASASSVSGTGSAEPSRPMKFPYTFTAKFVQFPWAFYVKNNWVYRYYFIAIIVCLPVVRSISNVFNSPTNVKKWEELKRKEHEAELLEHEL